MTKVKICGITNLEDAELSTISGADMIGFNFYPKSVRYIKPVLAGDISRSVHSRVKTVGIFVNESIDTICEAVERADIDMIQLHGDETTDYVDELKKFTDLEIVKAFRVASDFDIAQIGGYRINYVLLDTFSSVEYGGSGKTFDWTIAAKITTLYPNIFLSGGLSQSNVSDAIMAARPYAVDACSLLESEKGKKDPLRIKEFVRAAKATI